MEIQDFTNGENKIDAVRNFNRGSNRFRKPNKNLKVESKNVGNAEKCTGRRSEAYQCKKCGYTHTAGKCPAYGKTCSFCRKLHHFEIGCKIKKSAIQPRRTHAITEPSEESDDSLYLDSINAAVNKVEATKEWSVIGRIFGQKIKFKLDCGSQVNLLPLRCFKYLIPHRIPWDCSSHGNRGRPGRALSPSRRGLEQVKTCALPSQRCSCRKKESRCFCISHPDKISPVSPIVMKKSAVTNESACTCTLYIFHCRNPIPSVGTSHFE
ncbi:unnamed protein product, partial [Nesidiocoris tenuis]